ncbi:MAG: hypothetical protein R6U43_11015 [Candidatus Krumholzibacteriales bacterium]
MKKGLILTGLLIVAAVFYISCDNERGAVAPSVNEGNAGNMETMKTPGETEEEAIYIFALDGNEDQLSYRVFLDIAELELILSEEIVEEMKTESVSIIENAADVDEIRETIFAELPVSEYMNIQNIGSLYLQDVIESNPCSWSCAKICLCCEKCSGGKDTGLVPYQDWRK